MNREKSKVLFERAKKTLVGGVNSPVRSFKRVGGQAIFASRGDGPYIFDADNNQYIDFVMSYGPHLFGHAHPTLIHAVQESLKNSFCLGMSSEKEIEWAELFLEKVPHAEKVRAVSTGTEATQTAIRLARGVTGRQLIVKYAGHYHGHVDSLLVDSGSGLATLQAKNIVADSKGLAEALIQSSRVLPFNDLNALEELFKSEGTLIAGVILEPIMGNMGVVPPKTEYLKRLRELCTQYSALLIFDEVMTGFRVGPQSAQGLYSIKPDLSCFGKIVGGGLPLAALCGPAKYMDQLAPLGGVYQAGTLSGNPVSISAGIAMLKLLKTENPYEALETLGADVEAIYYEVAAKNHVKIRVERVGSMFSIYFREKAVHNANDCRDISEGQFNQYFWSMLDEGIMLPPSPFEACFLATVHKTAFKEKAFSEKLNKVFQRVGSIH